MASLKSLFNVLRHPIQSLKGLGATRKLTKNPAFTDTVQKLVNDPATKHITFDELDDIAKNLPKNGR